jgi:DNA-binding beta-propeller fold protein YncE
MTPSPSAKASAIAVLAGTLLLGCSFGESGVSPPLDGLFLPTGLGVDPTGDWVFVVNSNSDLRYNAGTVVAVDVRKAAEDRARTDWGDCPSAGYRPGGPPGTRSCCYDFHDPIALNCDERGYLSPGATVRIGSFGSTLLVSGGASGGPDRRLFVAVRADPSVTFIDATVEPTQVQLRCQEGQAAPNPVCNDSHKIRGGADRSGRFNLPEEPYAMAMDERLGALFVAHGIYGVSTIDLCAPGRPALVSVTNPVFPGSTPPFTQSIQAVSGLVVEDPGNPAGNIFALGRYVIDRPAEIQTLYLRGGDQPCGSASARELELVPGSSFYSSAFFPSGIDIRGFVLAADKERAYVLHRNPNPLSYYARDNPPALVAVDRSPDAQGRPVNRAVEVVEICSGPTELHQHDAGRGPRLYVVCFESGQVYVVDPDLMEVSAVINAGRGPTTLAFAPRDPTTAYLAGFSDNNVSVIDLKPGSPTENKVVQRIGFPNLRR